MTEKKSRLIGIDLVRGISAYAITLIHSGGYAASGYWATQVGDFSKFALPFFMATSFYLLLGGKEKFISYNFIFSKIKRLIVPYIIWSFIYLLFRVFKIIFLHKYDELITLFKDPVLIIFFGGSALHLYFLPLLFSGSILAIFLRKHLLKRKIRTLFLLFLVSFIIYDIVVLAGNSADRLEFNASYSIFYALSILQINPLIKIVLVELWWLLICLPYIIIAAILNHPYLQTNCQNLNAYTTLLFFFMFILINTSGRMLTPLLVTEFIVGHSLLFFAISLSQNLSQNNLISNLGVCCFGIYFVHHLIINLLQTIATKILPNTMQEVSIISLLIFSVFGFLISWIVTFCFSKNKVFSKYFLGN
jgi:hypothetical protein